MLDIAHAKTLDMSETNSRGLLTSGKVSMHSFIKSDWYLNTGSHQSNRLMPTLTAGGREQRANSLPRHRPVKSVFRRNASDDAEFNFASTSSDSDRNSVEMRCATAVKVRLMKDSNLHINI